MKSPLRNSLQHYWLEVGSGIRYSGEAEEIRAGIEADKFAPFGVPTVSYVGDGIVKSQSGDGLSWFLRGADCAENDRFKGLVSLAEGNCRHGWSRQCSVERDRLSIRNGRSRYQSDEQEAKPEYVYIFMMTIEMSMRKKQRANNLLLAYISSRYTFVKLEVGWSTVGFRSLHLAFLYQKF